MRGGLASKLIVSLTAIVVLGFTVFVWVDTVEREEQLQSEVVLSADLLSGAIVSSTWNAMLQDRRDAAYEVMRTIGGQMGLGKVRIFNKEGRIMFSTGDDQGLTVDRDAEACTLCHARAEPLVRVDVPSRVRTFEAAGGTRMLGMVTGIYNAPECSSAACHAHPADVNVLGVLDVSLSLERVDADVREARLRVVAGAIAAVLVMGLLIFLLVRRFVGRPVQALIDGTRSVGQMHLDQPIAVTSRDELGDLARSFNGMLEHLRAAREEVDRFTRTLEQEVEARTARLKATEQRLIRSDRLASIGQLAASVAHEINNPLSGVLNFAKLMQRLVTDQGIPPDRVADFRRYLEHVANETAHCGRIVSDLLAFSRRSSPQREGRSLNDLVQKTVSLLAHKLELEGARIELELSPDLPLVPCDGSQVQQIVINLLINAAEAMPGGGAISVRTRAAAGVAVLEVADRGVGIPEHVQARIFDPFFTTKEEGKGTGLGLAVVFGIVEAHGGSIDVESRVGEGTTFRVSLPLEATPPAAPAPDRGAT